MIKKFTRKAVALEYGSNPVPTLSARGDGAMAQAIINEAKSLGVHISEDPQLVSLLSELEVGDEIPESLYVSVAVILSWVYWLKGLQPEQAEN